MPSPYSGYDASDFQVPHTPMRPLPTENHRYRVLRPRSTNRRWAALTVLGCSRVTIGTISVLTYSSNT